MKKRDYNVKRGYAIRAKNAPYVDEQPNGVVYQPDVYRIVEFLVDTDEIDYVIDIGTGNGEKLMPIADKVQLICVENETNLETLKKNLPDATPIEHDLEKGLPTLPDAILERSLIISSDVIEHIVEPHKYIRDLTRLSKHVPYMILSTPDRTRARGPQDFGPPKNPAHVREWSIDELQGLLQDYGMNLSIGHTVSNDKEESKDTLLVLSGTRGTYHPTTVRTKPLVIISADSKANMLAETVEYYHAQGCSVHIATTKENSTVLSDVKKIAKSLSSICHLTVGKDIRSTTETITSKSKCKWVLRSKANERHMSPWVDVSLAEAVSFIDDQGFNTITSRTIDFFKVSHENTAGKADFMYDFVFDANTGESAQVSGGTKLLKNKPPKIYPLSFTTKRYNPMRDTSKISGYVKNFSQYVFYTEYMTERLTGIGTERLAVYRLSSPEAIRKSSKSVSKKSTTQLDAIAQLKQKNTALTSELNAVMNSKSWRVTKPMRSVIRQIKKTP